MMSTEERVAQCRLMGELSMYFARQGGQEAVRLVQVLANMQETWPRTGEKPTSYPPAQAVHDCVRWQEIASGEIDTLRGQGDLTAEAVESICGSVEQLAHTINLMHAEQLARSLYDHTPWHMRRLRRERRATAIAAAAALAGLGAPT